MPVAATRLARSSARLPIAGRGSSDRTAIPVCTRPSVRMLAGRTRPSRAKSSSITAVETSTSQGSAARTISLSTPTLRKVACTSAPAAARNAGTTATATLCAAPAESRYSAKHQIDPAVRLLIGLSARDLDDALPLHDVVGDVLAELVGRHGHCDRPL